MAKMKSAPVAASRGVAATLAPLPASAWALAARAVPDRDLKTLGQPIGGHAASHDAKTENRNALHEHAP